MKIALLSLLTLLSTGLFAGQIVVDLPGERRELVKVTYTHVHQQSGCSNQLEELTTVYNNSLNAYIAGDKIDLTTKKLEIDERRPNYCLAYVTYTTRAQFVVQKFSESIVLIVPDQFRGAGSVKVEKVEEKK